MRQVFLADCTAARSARKLAPWACRVIKADGGYWAFESSHNAAQWARQR